MHLKGLFKIQISKRDKNLQEGNSNIQEYWSVQIIKSLTSSFSSYMQPSACRCSPPHCSSHGVSNLIYFFSTLYLYYFFLFHFKLE